MTLDARDYHVKYYCPKCKTKVLTRIDMFNHPDLGMKSCLVCRYCGHQVRVAGEEQDKYAV